jgi:hypothetical protein
LDLVLSKYGGRVVRTTMDDMLIVKVSRFKDMGVDSYVGVRGDGVSGGE